MLWRVLRLRIFVVPCVAGFCQLFVTPQVNCVFEFRVRVRALGGVLHLPFLYIIISIIVRDSAILPIYMPCFTRAFAVNGIVFSRVFCFVFNTLCARERGDRFAVLCFNLLLATCVYNNISHCIACG